MAYKNTVKAEDMKCRAGIASKKYNIRGWMTGINDVDALAQPNDPDGANLLHGRWRGFSIRAHNVKN